MVITPRPSHASQRPPGVAVEKAFAASLHRLASGVAAKALRSYLETGGDRVDGTSDAEGEP